MIRSIYHLINVAQDLYDKKGEPEVSPVLFQTQGLVTFLLNTNISIRQKIIEVCDKGEVIMRLDNIHLVDFQTLVQQIIDYENYLTMKKHNLDYTKD